MECIKLKVMEGMMVVLMRILPDVLAGRARLKHPEVFAQVVEAVVADWEGTMLDAAGCFDLARML